MHNLSYRSLFSRDMQVELDNFAWQILWTRVNQRSPTAALTNKHININICLNDYNLIKWFHKKNILFLTFRPVSFLRGIAGPPSPPSPQIFWWWMKVVPYKWRIIINQQKVSLIQSTYFVIPRAITTHPNEGKVTELRLKKHSRVLFF